MKKYISKELKKLYREVKKYDTDEVICRYCGSIITDGVICDVCGEYNEVLSDSDYDSDENWD